MLVLSTTAGMGSRQNSAGNNSLQKKSGMDSFIDNLMKQKQKITDSRNSLIQKTTEDGKSLQTIKPQLDDYEEQLKDINKKIAEITLEKHMKALGADKDSAKTSSDQPKTEQQAQNQQFGDILGISGDMQKIKVLASAETKMHGQAAVLGQEIALDEARAQSGQRATVKRDRLSKIEDGLASVSQKRETVLKDIDGKSQESSDTASKAALEKTGKARGELNVIIGTYKGARQSLTEPAEKPKLNILA